MTVDDLPIQMVKITGTPGNGFWSQVHTFTPQEIEKQKTRGELMAIITVPTKEEGVGAVSYGRDILGRFHEEYYGRDEDNAFERLGKAIERITIESPNSQMAVAVILGDKLILGVSFGATVWLKRGGEFGLLLKTSEKVELLMGDMVKNDTILLSSQAFSEIVPVGTLKTVMGGGLQEAGEIVGPIILGHEQSGGAAGLFIRINEVEKQNDLGDIERFDRPTITSINETRVVDQITNQPKQDIYLKSVRWKRLAKKILPLVGILLAIMLVLIGLAKIIGGIKKSRAEAKSKILVSALMDKVNKGAEQIEVDPSGINELVSDLETDMKTIDGLGVAKTDEYQKIVDKINKIRDESNQAGFIKNPTVYMDLSLVEDGVEGRRMIIVGNQLLILTSEGSSLVVFDLAKRSYKNYDLEKNILLMAGDASKVYGVGDRDIVEISPSNGKLKTIVTNTGWSSADGIAVYSGNAYILDIQKPSIWRFPAIEGGLGIGSNWLKEEVSLANSVGLMVDGSVWLLDKDKIRKFSLGEADSFSVSDEKFELTEASFLWTSYETQELLVLDKVNGRLYRIGKDGKLVKSYQSPAFKSTVSLASDGKKAYLLDGKKIFEVGLE